MTGRIEHEMSLRKGERPMRMTKKMKESLPPEANGTPAPSDGLSRRGIAGEAEPPPAEARMMSPTERKKAFAEYDKANTAVEAAREALEHAIAFRSHIVAKIAAGCGRGPFGYKGLVLTAVARTNKSTGE